MTEDIDKNSQLRKNLESCFQYQLKYLKGKQGLINVVDLNEIMRNAYLKDSKNPVARIMNEIGNDVSLPIWISPRRLSQMLTEKLIQKGNSDSTDIQFIYDQIFRVEKDEHGVPKMMLKDERKEILSIQGLKVNKFTHAEFQVHYLHVVNERLTQQKHQYYPN